MVVTECYGKNIYLGDQLVGYISRLPDGDSAWYIARRKKGSADDRGWKNRNCRKRSWIY